MTFFRLITLVAAMAMLLFVGACASGPAPAAAPAAPATLPAAEAATDALAGYTLDSGDRLRVTVFGEEALSGEFVVDGTGLVSMPLVGEVEVVGLTVREFQRSLEAKLADGYLNSPRVAAEVINYRPYYILGEVGDPGEYPYTAGLTVMNAVATAGGFSYRANRKTVFIRRQGGQEMAVTLTSSTSINPGDTIRIGERLF
ncbi:MAG: polysaccharide biosynthesis/export family protein [Pseudomonadota bacterium]